MAQTEGHSGDIKEQSDIRPILQVKLTGFAGGLMEGVKERGTKDDHVV
jgi:hypothetical protein